MSTEERVQIARDYFKQGYNCSQSVVMAFSDILGVDGETLERLSLGLGGGVGRMREVCGAVTGMAIVAGSLIPEDRDDKGNRDDKHARKQAAYTLIQELADKFRQENGSIVCRDLLALRAGAKLSPVPQERTADYYKTRPCEEMVACAVRLLVFYASGSRRLRKNI